MPYDLRVDIKDNNIVRLSTDKSEFVNLEEVVYEFADLATAAWGKDNWTVEQDGDYWVARQVNEDDKFIAGNGVDES